MHCFVGSRNKLGDTMRKTFNCVEFNCDSQLQRVLFFSQHSTDRESFATNGFAV